jgi:hypothetical protein
VTELYKQCLRVYDRMMDTAADGVYRGYLTYLFEDLGLGVSRYTPVMRRLVGMGCVRQKTAGGRGTMSQWELIKRPTEALYAEAASRRRRSRIADLEQRVALLEEAMRRWANSQTENVAS